MTEAWPSLKPINGLLSDLALLALILPGIFLAHFVLFAEDAPWAARLLVLSLDLSVVTLIVLLALFLNRWLRYRLSSHGIEIFGVGGWFGLPPQSVTGARLVTFSANPWGYKAGINGLSGMVYGVFDTDLGKAHLYGYAYAGCGVLLERPDDKPVLLTPAKPKTFLDRLYALGYGDCAGRPARCYTFS